MSVCPCACACVCAGETLLHIAIQAQDNMGVDYLLKKRADVLAEVKGVFFQVSSCSCLFFHASFYVFLRVLPGVFLFVFPRFFFCVLACFSRCVLRCCHVFFQARSSCFCVFPDVVLLVLEQPGAINGSDSISFRNGDTITGTNSNRTAIYNCWDE